MPVGLAHSYDIWHLQIMFRHGMEMRFTSMAVCEGSPHRGHGNAEINVFFAVN